MKTYITKSDYISRISLYLFPALTAFFVGAYFANENFYRWIISEDHLIEWLTFSFLIGAGIVSLILAIRIKEKNNYLHWFFILFFVFNILAGFEEISWGQRVFEVQSGEFFQKHSDQNEINLHNTFQGVFHIKTKHIALIVLFCYGVLLPWLVKTKKIKSRWIEDQQFIVPPRFLTTGFLIATIFMLDFQTGNEEEIGEFFFSICFFLMMLWNLKIFKEGNAFNIKTYFSKSKSTPSLSA